MEYIKVGSVGFETEIPQLKACETPRQVRWRDFDFDSEFEEIIYGIQVGDKIICACCGGIFPIDELNEQARESLCTNWVEVREDWISFTDEMTYNW